MEKLKILNLNFSFQRAAHYHINGGMLLMGVVLLAMFLANSPWGINFISIYSSNLEEFYKIRVADHKAVASGVTDGTEESLQSAKDLLEEINREVPISAFQRASGHHAPEHPTPHRDNGCNAHFSDLPSSIVSYHLPTSSYTAFQS